MLPWAQSRTRRLLGKPPADAGSEPGVGAPAQFRFFADHGAEFLADEPIDLRDGHAVVVKQALGVILGIVRSCAPPVPTWGG